MDREQGGNRWRVVRSLALGVGVCFLAGCAMDAVTGTGDEAPLFAADNASLTKAVGEVEIIWPKSLKQDVPEGEEKLAFVQLEAFPAADQPVRGSFTFRVLNLDSTLHREIVAELTGVIVDPVVRKAWYVGTVVSDEKICSGGCGGHDGGEGGEGGGCDDGTHDDGGCSGHDTGTGDEGGCSGHDTGTTEEGSTHEEGGCSGGGGDTGGMGGDMGGGDMGGGDMGGGDMGGGCSDGTHDDGGCTDGGTHDDGGCTDGGTHDDGGCSGGDSHDDGGCSGGGSSGGHGEYHVSGKDPRVGQIIVGKMHDGGTPGVDLDGITWKWFHPENPNLPSIDDIAAWPHLCKKTIIGGNLKIHPEP